MGLMKTDKGKKGFLITLEGIEGSGKSTQCERLVELLKQHGHCVKVFREPGGTPVGEAIRNILLHPDGDVAEITELFLFEAARHQLVTGKIKPALANGDIVILDRFYDATTAYQGYGRGLDLDVILQMTRYACGGVVPDLTILLDIDPEIGLRRCVKRKGKEFGGEDRIESSGIDFLKRVRDGYSDIAANEPERFVIIRVTENIEETFSQVLDAVKERTTLLSGS